MKTLICLSVAVGVVLGAQAQAPVPNVAPKRTRAISLAWDASVTPGVSYVLRRGIASGKYEDMVDLPAGTLAYVWTNAPSAMTNYFVVTAKASGVTNGVSWEEESVYSNEVAAVPRGSPEPPNLRTAVPITVEIYRREPGQLWAKVIDVGPFYDEADRPAEEFSAIVRTGKAVKLLPE